LDIQSVFILFESLVFYLPPACQHSATYAALSVVVLADVSDQFILVRRLLVKYAEVKCSSNLDSSCKL